MKHLLSRRLRAALNLQMSIWDWICHGWWLVFDPKYRTSVRSVKNATSLPKGDKNDRSARQAATTYLRRKFNDRR